MKVTKSQMQLIEKIAQAQYLSRDDSHGWEHVKQVLSNVLMLADNPSVVSEIKQSNQYVIKENFELVLVVSTVLHDAWDHKYVQAFPYYEETVQRKISTFLEMCEIKPTPELVADIFHTITKSSWSKGVAPDTAALALLQDADRLDAIGARGIARCMTYNAAKKNTMADAIQHFKDKLLKIHTTLNFEYSRHLAKERTEILKSFMKAFEEESICK